MKAKLVVNSFIQTKKFTDIYEFFLNSSKKFNISFEIITTSTAYKDLFNDGFCGVDFVIFWDKDIYLARQIEELGIKVFNSSKCIEICDNKALTYLALKNAKLPIPTTILAPKTFDAFGYNNLDFYFNAKEILSLPMVIKENYGSFGAQVYLADSDEKAKEIISSLGAKEFLMQEFIASSYGKDIRVNVVGSNIVSAMERINENDFRSNITNGGIMKKTTLSKEFEQVALLASKAVGADFCGVDIMFSKTNSPIVCEVNSNPNFKSSFECNGVDISYKILEYIVGNL